jgi:hypothetical protein
VVGSTPVQNRRDELSTQHLPPLLLPVDRPEHGFAQAALAPRLGVSSARRGNPSQADWPMSR